jgi:hypothetical protein
MVDTSIAGLLPAQDNITEEWRHTSMARARLIPVTTVFQQSNAVRIKLIAFLQH